MRLIDAAKLEKDIEENIIVKSVSRVLAIIQGQRTVKAIPLDWISKYTKKPISYAEYWGIIRLILTWEENEKSN